MRKMLIIVTVVAVFVSFAAAAFAADNTIGFQFRVPFQATSDKNIKDVNGQSVLLTFFLDQDTEIGILNESIGLTDKTAGSTFTGYDVTALRISKNIMSPMYVGLDLGNMSFNGAAGSTTMADVFGGLKLLQSKNRVTSFLDVELDYRIAKTTIPTSDIKDLGGVMVNLSAGINF